MRCDGLRDLRRLAVALDERSSDLGVRAFLLVIECLADVVQQARATRELHVRPELGRDEAREVPDLDGVQQHVLRVRLAELEAPEVLYQLGMQAMNTEVEHGLLAGLLALRVDFLLRLAHHFFDARGMDAPVGNQRTDRDACDLATHGVEARDRDRLRRVIDDHVDARRCFERADVAALASDQPALQVIRR
jgi:hypothetical protein